MTSQSYVRRDNRGRFKSHLSYDQKKSFFIGVFAVAFVYLVAYVQFYYLQPLCR